MIYYRGKDYRMCTATILWRTIKLRTCVDASQGFEHDTFMLSGPVFYQWTILAF